jgi:hypothetical protein
MLEISSGIVKRRSSCACFMPPYSQVSWFGGAVNRYADLITHGQLIFGRSTKGGMTAANKMGEE